MTRLECLIAGVISLILYVLAEEYLIEVPIIGWLIVSVGWLLPVVFFYGVFEKRN